MGYNPQESLENTVNTMGTLVGVHHIVPWDKHPMTQLIGRVSLDTSIEDGDTNKSIGWNNVSLGVETERIEIWGEYNTN